MKTKFRFLGLVATICLVICAVFAGCLSAADYEAIYNDDAKIASSSSGTTIGSVEQSTNSSYTLSCSSFSGVKIIINSFTVNENTSANLSFKVTDGKCKVVLVKGDTVYKLAEGNYDGALDFSSIPEGKYMIKLVGVEAEIKLDFKY